ncbi:MAG: hypothetical protein AUJ72_05045 [Candidatus Omnitrophica bacterium CG1_02_46_14]|nr:MAG: hypothetical protein AUJ72_05045 [Candidatus Omnitrophica bacterium CG1_02_46_14]
MKKARVLSLVILAVLVLFFINGCARAPRRVGTIPYVSSMAVGPGFTHTVERGETLYRIAKNYRVEMSDLMRVNNIYNPTALEAGQRIFIPQGAAPPVIAKRPGEPLSFAEVRSLVGPRNLTSDWRTITVHHSGTTQGGARLFDKDHHRRRMGGLFYHFVIGNGTKTPLGSVEVGWRWRKQVKANRPYDIQICLVGNFDKQEVSEGQFSSLVNLVRVLQEEYRIPISSVRKHNDIPGKHTDCPGRRFPFSRLIATLNDTR